MTSAEHADLEAISAYVDGEAPEWADHVAACASCRATAARLRAVAVAVSRPVVPPSAADRERAIAAALGAVAARDQPVPTLHDAHRARFGRRRGPDRPWAVPAVAAVVVGLLGASGLVLSSYRTPDNTTTAVAGRAPETDAKADALLESGRSGVAAAAPSPPPSDLGDLPDATTLRARAQLAVPSGGASASQSNSVAPAVTSGNSGTTSGAGGAAVQTPTTTLTQRVAPSVVGTRPCEEQARTREPTLGPVVYFATARRGAVAGYVLGFGPIGAPAVSPPVTLLLLAQDGCAELLRSAGP